MESMVQFLLPASATSIVLLMLYLSKKVSRNSHVSVSKVNGVRMAFLYTFGRRIVYGSALVWALILYGSVAYTIPSWRFALSTLMRYYAFSALALLYIVLVPGLFLSYFPKFAFNGLFIHLRRAVGVCVFFFAITHAMLGFYINLSGSVSSFSFLSERNQFSIFLAVIALLVLLLLTVTSFDLAQKILKNTWKKIHRLVYVASIFVLFHAFLIGSHFTNPTAPIPLFINFVSLAFILLEVGATVKRRLIQVPGFANRANILWWISLSLVIILGYTGSYVGLVSKYDPHAKHRKGYSKNYSLNLDTSPKKIQKGVPAELRLSIVDKRTGTTLKRFQILQEKLMHIIVLRNDLLTYDHIHPEYDKNGNFSISHVFEAEGAYTLYVEYSAPDFSENLSIGSVVVGEASANSKAVLAISPYSKTINDMIVSLQFDSPIQVNESVDFAFMFTQKDGTEITDLEPYLASFGHMSVVSDDMKHYTHVHPVSSDVSLNDRGGPSVRFSTFFQKKGLYKIFLQFKRNGTLHVTDFVIKVQ